MIKIENLKKTYDKGSRHAHEVLHGLSFELPDTGFVCILGASGCGKTSLLNAIGGLDLFDSGKIITERAKITRASSRVMERERNASFGYIFQNYYLLAEHSAAYNVYLGMHSMGLSRKEKLARVRDALERVDMLRYRKRPVGELSGGQMQRVAIARAIARRPRVIFADEPTGNLDEANTMNICSILKELSRESLVVMVTHEERIARFFADRIITLDEGRIESDVTEWDRGTIDAGAKDTVYTGDYVEEKLDADTEKISLRLLHTENAPAVKLTVVAEADRIIIKVNDPRVVLCSEPASAPFIAEGKRPILDAGSFDNIQPDATAFDDSEKTQKAGKKRGLGFSMLFSEARSLVSEKKLRKFGTSVFIILLTLMLSFSVADFITVARIDPEDFITTDSHILGFKFERGPLMDKYMSTSSNINEFRKTLNDSGVDIDYIPSTNTMLKYYDSTVWQFGELFIEIGGSRAELSRLDESTIIKGRAPERYDEIVVDRWVIDDILESEGIVQNVIPSADYLLGKTLTAERKTTKLKIVGICDSGEPTIYMSREALLSFGTCGSEIITLSEYQRITGELLGETLSLNVCIVISDNVSRHTGSTIGVSTYVGSGYKMEMKKMINTPDNTIGAKLIIADEALDPLYDSMIASLNSFSIWCADKSEVYSFLDESISENVKNMLKIEVNDKYARDIAEYEEKTSVKLDARTIVTFTVIISCVFMLYLMQRSKIKDRMDLVAVYRLLGIPKRDLMSIFAMESIFLTLRYALPSVAVAWALMQVASKISFFSAIAMYFPVWAAGLTLVAIALYRLLVAILPVLHLLGQPPARLASKYDF